MTGAANLKNVEDVYPLTPAQAGMLYHSIAESGTGVYMEQIVGRLDGPLDPARFADAWQQVVQRHAVLRTALLWDGLDQPLQVVRNHVVVPVIDAPTGLDLATRLQRDRAVGIDLATAPLVRVQLWREHGVEWHFLLTFHHIVCDGWSARILLDEVIQIYHAGSAADAGLAAPVPYREHVSWLESQDRSAALEHWRIELEGFDQPTPLDQPPVVSAPSGRPGDSIHRALDTQVTHRLRNGAARERVTLGTMVQAAWALVVSRWARTDDVVYGVVSSGRPPDRAGLDRAVGMYINTLPLRVRLDSDAQVGDWMRAIQQGQLSLRENDHTPLTEIQRLSEVEPGRPLFDSIVAIENLPGIGEPSPTQSVTLGSLEFHEQSNYPLAVLVVPGDELEFTVVFDGTRYSESWVSTVLDDLCLVVERLGGEPTAPLGDLTLVSAADAAQLDEWNGSPVAVRESSVIHAMVERVAAETPDRTAVIAGSDQVSYRDLDERANAVAAGLRERGAQNGDRVGIAVERSVDMIVAVLGVLKAGCAYVPLDPSYPEARNATIADDARLHSILTEVTADRSAEPPPIGRDRRGVAYVLYTSGSTGRPKGVEVTHANLVASTNARDDHYGAGPAAFLLLSSFAFDSSVVGIFWTLCTGGALVLPAPGEEQDVARLGEIIEEHAVTHLLALPSLYSLLLEGSAANLGSLRTAIVAGEACSAAVVERHFAALPTAELHNEYGPTEATVWTTVHRASPGDPRGPVPIGRVISTARAHVLDTHRRTVPIGFPGELWIGGSGVAAGYLERPELTAERFVELDPTGHGAERLYRSGDLVAHRPDGALLFLGRSDEQVKIRGHRIETGEVEAALCDLVGVDEAAVVGRRLDANRVQLVGYVVASDTIDTRSLRTELADRLPEYMVPNRIIALGTMPRLANGKLDLKALPEGIEPSDAAELVPPSTPTERSIAALWIELLALEHVGVHEDFFDVGGDSIVGIRLISRARHAGLHIEPRDLVRHPTIAQLAAVADQNLQPVAIDHAVAGPVPLSPIQQWFFERRLTDPSHSNLSRLFEVPPDLDADAVAVAIEACIATHPQLRARFVLEGDRWHQSISEEAATAPPILHVDDRADLFDVQSHLDLEEGRLVAGALHRGSEDSAAQLLVAVHHLVIDVASWDILVDDLEAAYRAAAAGNEVNLPPTTMSYRDWVTRAASAPPSLDRPAFDPPTDLSGAGYGTERSSECEVVVLEAPETARLVGEANDAYNTRIEDLVAAALVRVVCAWAGRPSAEFTIEGHGRSDDLDLSRTIGWFTEPSLVVASAPADPGDLVRSVKEALRGRRAYHGPSPAINFDYLGRVAEPSPAGVFRPIDRAEASSHHPDNERSHLLGIVASVRSDRLFVEFHFSTERHHRSTIAGLANRFTSELLSILSWCCDHSNGGFTPSDFPEAGLDQDALDDFLDEVI